MKQDAWLSDRGVLSIRKRFEQAMRTGPLLRMARYQPELNMVATMDRERFGSCTNMSECEAVCPKEIGLYFISRMNRDLIRASFRGRKAFKP